MTIVKQRRHLRRLRSIAGHRFEGKLWVRCQMCERVVTIDSEWFQNWWLAAPRVRKNVRSKVIVRCPEHVTWTALVTGGIKWARTKAFRYWNEERVHHFDDEPQPPPHTPIIFPSAEEYEMFTSHSFDSDFRR